MPEIWVADDDQLALAKRLLDALQHRPQRRWHCQCGELVEGGFEQWKEHELDIEESSANRFKKAAPQQSQSFRA